MLLLLWLLWSMPMLLAGRAFCWCCCWWWLWSCIDPRGLYGAGEAALPRMLWAYGPGDVADPRTLWAYGAGEGADPLRLGLYGAGDAERAISLGDGPRCCWWYASEPRLDAMLSCDTEPRWLPA